MSRKLLLLALTAATLAACSSLTQPTATEPPTPATQRLALSQNWSLIDAAKVTDTPEQISAPAYAPKDWIPATVPGTVLTSMVNNKIYPEPLYGENNRPNVIPESLARATYYYRTTFQIPPTAPGKHLWLNLDGINYFADIYLNGTKLGTIKGAFSRGRFDITPYVTPGQTAALAVKITPPPHPGNPQEQTVANGTGPNGGTLAQDGPTFLASIGWDWMPAIRDRNVGIWQKVFVSETGPVSIHDPLVVTDLPLPKTDAADLTISTTVQNTTDQPVTGTLTGAIENISLQKEVTLAPHESKVIKLTPADFPQLHLTNPRLWWPNTYGPQNLYPLTLTFNINDQPSDIKSLHFGVREISYHVPTSENLTLSVNGVPIICKGGNWGMDEAMKRSPRERLDAQIRMHQQANYTMIRNWVGQSTSEDFYDLCDRYGMLIWDECFQPNPSDGPNPNDTELYLANVREKVLRFRSHPSIAVWCARNEGNPPAAIDAGIKAIMDELEPVRLYQKNSNDGRGVRSGGPYAWRPPAAYYTFNANEPFKTELGSVSIPTLQAIQNMMPEKDWWPLNNDDWASHDLLRGAQQGDQFPGTIARRYGPSSDLPDFVRKGTLATYEAYRAMYEGRFAKLFNPVTGVITWMSNPAQPSMVWQLYTHDLEPNAALFATRTACEPLHIQMSPIDARTCVVNASPTPHTNLHARLRVFNLDSSLAGEKTLPIPTVNPNAATDLGPIDFPKGITPVHFVKLELLDDQNHLLSENFYWRTTKVVTPATAPATAPGAATRPAGGGGGQGRGRGNTGPQEDFTDLQSLKPAPVQITFTRKDTGPTCTLTATLTNPTDTIALLTHVQLRKANSNTRALPAFYSNNYITLLPKESKTITIETPLTALNNEPPKLTLDGYNIP